MRNLERGGGSLREEYDMKGVCGKNTKGKVLIRATYDVQNA